MTAREQYVAGLARISAANDQLNKAVQDGDTEAAQRAEAERDAADEALLALNLPAEAGPLTSSERFMDPARRRSSASKYANAMEAADRLYADIVAALQAEGFANASVWQTGGMCLAIGINLDDPATDWHVLIGDADNGPLVWERTEPVVWEMGVYGDPDTDTTAMVPNTERTSDPVAYAKQVAPLLRQLQQASPTKRLEILHRYES
jgi:hypothetical protein